MKAISPLLRLDGIAKTYANGLLALCDVNLSLDAREFISLLGPSGCGKSTILRLIAGLVEPSAGHITWPDDTLIFKTGTRDARPAIRTRNIGFVFQEPTLMPWARVFDNVYLPLRLAGESRAASQTRVEEAIALVGLAGFETAFPRELSGGMKMRVSIARALVTQPDLLLMDEPFAALDEISRLKLNNDLLKVWAERKLTVIFVTHSVYESVYLSQRVLVMSNRPGHIVADIKVDAPHPRDEMFRTSSDYNHLCRDASAALQRAMTGAQA